MNEHRPHVIFLIIDAGGFKHTSLGGYFRDTTPFLKEFANEAVQYERAFSVGPISGLSISSFMTSSYAFDHQTKPIEVGTDRPTIATALHDVGYFTALMTSNPYYAKHLGYQHGVDHYKLFFSESEELRRIQEGGLPMRLLKLLNRVPVYRGAKTLFKAYARRLYEIMRQKKTAAIMRQSPFGDAVQANNEILRVLKERPKHKPLFLLAQYMDLHAPHLPPDSYMERFGSVIRKEKQYDYWQKRSMRPLPEFSKEEVDDLIFLYDACLAHIDTRIREVVEQLKREGMYDDSMIVITADHGEAFFEHGDLGHHALLYEENIRVPLLIKYPRGERKGTTVDEVVSHIDIASTIMTVVGEKAPGTFQGMDLTKDPGSRGHAISFVAFKRSPKNFTDLDFKNYALSIRTKHAKHMTFSKRPEEFYDLSTDPEERNNLLNGQGATPSRVPEELAKALEPYRKRIEGQTG